MTEDERPFTKVGFWTVHETGNTPHRRERETETETEREGGRERAGSEKIREEFGLCQRKDLKDL